MLHNFVAWERGPEDATHFVQVECRCPWLKVEGERVYFANDYPHGWWEWVEYYAKAPNVIHLEGALVKPIGHVALLPVVIINGVEVDWNKAPEGTTHASTNEIAINKYGQWRRVEGRTISDWSYERGEWEPRDWLDARVWLEANDYAIVKHPNLIAGKPAVEPVKVEPAVALKKPIGWWS